jgi:hypothetical protein
MVKISPNFDVNILKSPITVETLIDIYEDRLNGWILEPARILLEYEHGGFAILQILCSYFESYSMYEKGELSKSATTREFFKSGFLSVFNDIPEKFSDNNIEEIIDIMYCDFRCGLDHWGLTKERIEIIDGKNAIACMVNPFIGNHIEKVSINCFYFIKAIENHSSYYIHNLRDNNKKELRAHFEKVFREQYWSKPWWK